MKKIDLKSFGLPIDCQVFGNIEDWYNGDKGILFVFGEKHRDRGMIRHNLLNACILINTGVIACVGTEDVLELRDDLSDEELRTHSNELFKKHKADDSVIDYLSRRPPWWFGESHFGNILRVLRPSLPVRCVEDPDLREQFKPIASAYDLSDLGPIPHPYPDHPNMGDHPLNIERERAMVQNLLDLWESTDRESAAVLNIGLAHCERIVDRVRALGISYIRIAVPASQ